MSAMVRGGNYSFRKPNMHDLPYSAASFDVQSPLGVSLFFLHHAGEPTSGAQPVNVNRIKARMGMILMCIASFVSR